jgi:hypothetical protein
LLGGLEFLGTWPTIKKLFPRCFMWARVFP